MRISRIYVGESLAIGSSIKLDTAASHYIRHVLRLKHGAIVALFNGQDICDYRSRLEFDGKQTIAIVESKDELQTESPLESEIIQGLSRSDHLDFSIQKCTELGVKKISIFNAEHSQIPVKLTQLDKRLSHWRAIAIKACEQSGRHMPPVIEFYKSLDVALDVAVDNQIKILLNFDGKTLPECLKNARQEDRISILIGPEGGLSENEIRKALSYDFRGARLGPRVLRTETAAIASLAIVQVLCGDFEA